jgi:DNA gyrase inhibitor GyrI
MLIACVHQEEPCSFEEEGFIFLARILKECNLRPGFPLMVTVADVATDSVSWSPQRYRCGVTIHPHLGEVTNLKHDRIASGTYAGAHFNGAMHTEANAYEWIVQDFLPRNGLKRRDGPVLHTSLVLQQPESLNLYSSDLFVPVVATK